MSKEKEVIIDGVNISECRFYHNGNCSRFKTKDNDLTAICSTSCDFGSYQRREQLKRLQQENEELKKERNQAVNEFNTLMTDIMVDIPFTGIAYTKITPLSHLNKMQKALKALKEIKPIIEKYITDCAGFKCEGMEEIQTKINEVLNNEIQ